MKYKLVVMIIGATCCMHAAKTQMIKIPAGTFKRSDGKTVKVKTFSILNREVTWSQYKTVKDWACKHGYNFEEGIGKADFPAQNITWYDAVKWCNALSEMTGKNPVYYKQGNVYKFGRADLKNNDVKWAANGFRLPTEAEWEYAYRAGTVTKLFWGNYKRPDEINHQYAAFHVWGTDEIDGSPIRGALKKPNAFGLYDMAGNVEEWVWDRYSTGYKGVDTDNPRGVETGYWRVMRGGGFVIDRIFTADARHPSYPFWVNCDIGFRIASSDPDAQAQALSKIKPLPLEPNDTKAFSEPIKLLDIRQDTDKAACERLMPLLDLNKPNLKAVKSAYDEKDCHAALNALRNLLVPRLKDSDLKPWQATYTKKQEADAWLKIFKEHRPIRWVGPDTDLKSAWDFKISNHLSKAYARYKNPEYARAFFWMLNDLALYGKPTWNRLSALEKGSKGKPRYCFYTFIGFDAGHPVRPFANIAWMLKHGLSDKNVPPRVLANALYFAVTDRLAGGLQDDRANVPNQVWGNAMALIEFSLLFPELKDSQDLLEEGTARVKYAMGTVMPDGSDLEASLNYNATLFKYQEQLNHLFAGYAQKPQWLKEFNKRTNYRRYMYAALATPFATFPAVGNQQPTDTRPRKKLKTWLKGGELKGLESEMNCLLYGKALKKPAFTSIGMPYGGYYVQRSGWKSDDLYLFMRSSRDGVGHNHHDNNNIQVAAYGAWLLLDSGSPAYGPVHLPPHQKKYSHYFGEAGLGNVFMANCLSVDGLYQESPLRKVKGPTSGWETPRKNLLHFSGNFDLTQGIYDGWYISEKPISDKILSDLIEDYGMYEVAPIISYNKTLKDERKLKAKHSRTVIFLRKEKFWVVVDQIDGGSKYIQTWNFPAGDKGLNTSQYFLAPKDEDLYHGKIQSIGYTPSQVRYDEKLKCIATISHYRPNIGILNFSSAPIEYKQHYGNKFPFRGWQSFGIGGEKVPAVQMEAAWRGSTPMVTALFPMKNRHYRATTLNAGLEGFNNTSQQQISGFTYRNKKLTISVLASREPETLTIDRIKAEAKFLLVKNDAKGNVSGIALGCKLFTVDGKKHLCSENFEFMINKNGVSLKNIKYPSAFNWKKNSKGQLVPTY